MKSYLVRGATVMVLAGLALGGAVAAQPQDVTAVPVEGSRVSMPASEARYAGSGAELHEGQWTGGGSIGILGSSPDGTALAMNGNMEYFVNDRVSIGPLLQMGFTDDMTQTGLSGQAKYWIDLPGTGGRGKANIQSGIGFTHADFRASDTSWLVPIGVGYDYTLDSGTSLTGTALMNFTNLHTGGGTGADFMPGFAFGIRF